MKEYLERLRQIVYEAVDIGARANIQNDNRQQRAETEQKLLQLSRYADDLVAAVHGRLLGDKACVVGRVAAEVTSGGDLVISEARSPAEHFVVKQDDVDDLMVALDGALQQQKPKLPTLTEVTAAWLFKALDDFTETIAERVGKAPVKTIALREDFALSIGITPGGRLEVRTPTGSVELISDAPAPLGKGHWWQR